MFALRFSPFALLLMASLCVLCGCNPPDAPPVQAVQPIESVAPPATAPSSNPVVVEPTAVPPTTCPCNGDCTPVHFARNEAIDYATAYAVATTENRPLLVLVTARWCGACPAMEAALAQLRARGDLDRVAFTQIDLDADRETADLHTGGGPIPALVLWTRATADAPWQRKKLVGARPVDELARWLRSDP